MNVLKKHLRITVETLLAHGLSQREISKRTGVNRRTIRAQAAKCSRVATGFLDESGQTAPPWPPVQDSNSPGVATGFSEGGIQTAPPRPPAFPTLSVSACEVHRSFIEAQVALGRNAVAIYQDLVDDHGFSAAYNSVKRFVRVLKARSPERFDVLEYPAGEECQVDFGQGAPTRVAGGKYRRPHLFVMTLKYSGKSFRKVVWKADQHVWARLHEEAWRSFGGSCTYVVLDNLRQGVIKPDLYEPQINSVYAALLAHYGVVADVCRVRDPNRKGTVESAIQHTQSTALKGRRFESIEEQNAKLAHWEEHWASLRIHGRKKRQVLEMYHEEKPFLRPLPIEPFRYFREGVRTVDDAGLVQIDAAYYPALPAALYSEVTVRIYDNEVEILHTDGRLLRRHEKSPRRGYFALKPEDRIFNPSRETLRLLAQVAKIGPHTGALGETLFARFGRPGQKALYGLSNLTRTYARADIEAVAQIALADHCLSLQSIKNALKRRAAAVAPPPALTQAAPEIRAISEYQDFFDTHTHPKEPNP